VTEIRHRRVPASGVELHVAYAGAGVPVILLHGFPEFWYSWRHQMTALAAAGYQAIAPDMRGYNLSDRPDTLEAYHLRHLVADVAAIVRATGRRCAHVVGHDWGGVVAWTLAGMHPELVDRLVIMNAPHMRIYRRRLRRPSQLVRSAYLPVFRIPRLPEFLLSARRYALLRRLYRTTPARRGTFDERDIDRYVEAMSLAGRAHRRAELLPRQLGRRRAPARFRGEDPCAYARHLGKPRPCTARKQRRRPRGSGAEGAGASDPRRGSLGAERSRRGSESRAARLS
jgi:pimeloyl-ACP methyl ester carboxylesterase